MKDGTAATRLEELLTRLEVAILRLEQVGLMPPTDPEAIKAAEEMVKNRRWELFEKTAQEAPNG